MVYELVWKNQRLNCFTHARSGTYTPLHEKNNLHTHINTRTNDRVAVTGYTSTPLLLFLLSRKKVAVAICQRIQAFLFGSFHMQAQILHTSINAHTHIQHALTQVHLHTECTNRKQPKQTLDYTSHYSSRESHQSI